MVNGPIEYLETKGDHLNILLPTYVENVANIIKKYLKNQKESNK